jgi:hypothetical protein
MRMNDRPLNQDGSWLPDMDLNHDKQIQSLLCYRYTIGQYGLNRLPTFIVPSSRENPVTTVKCA